MKTFLNFAFVSLFLASAALAGNALTIEIAHGPFQPSWESLESQYQCPEWFRDAKFGIWAHWTAAVRARDGRLVRPA